MLPELIRLRRRLHQIPELDFALPETLAFLRGELEKLDCQVFSPIPQALCAWFGEGKGETVAFRADMDALPLEEKGDCPYSSRHPGRMHACGHDGHMAILLGLAQALSRRRGALPKNVLLLFQPAEETTGGARLLCESGVLEEYGVGEIYGYHLWPELPAGALVSRPGPLLAKSSETTLSVTGRAAHIARASQGADALLAAARFVTGADDLFARLAREEPCLLKFGRLESGSARNAISDKSLLLGSLRVFSQEMFDRATGELEALARTVGAQTGCSLQLTFSQGYPPVRNDPRLFARAEELLPALETAPQPLLIAEDFSFYQQRVPGLFLLLGTGRDIPLHADTFDFDERALAAGLEGDLRLLGLEPLPHERSELL